MLRQRGINTDKNMVSQDCLIKDMSYLTHYLTKKISQLKCSTLTKSIHLHSIKHENTINAVRQPISLHNNKAAYPNM